MRHYTYTAFTRSLLYHQIVGETKNNVCQLPAIHTLLWQWGKLTSTLSSEANLSTMNRSTQGYREDKHLCGKTNKATLCSGCGDLSVFLFVCAADQRDPGKMAWNNRWDAVTAVLLLLHSPAVMFLMVSVGSNFSKVLFFFRHNLTRNSKAERFMELSVWMLRLCGIA